MAAFSYQQPPFVLDSIFLPSIVLPIKAHNSLQEDGNVINPNTFIPQFYPSDSVREIPVNNLIHETTCLMVPLPHSDTEPSTVIQKQRTDSSSMDDHKLEKGEQVTQKIATPLMEKKRKGREIRSSHNSAKSKETKEGKGKKQRKCNGASVKDNKNDSESVKKNEKKVAEQAPPPGYIHVRARRGQATDSHSLAERVRREKISERMKMLQGLVPGCDKVTGKALMLDEIINYVQSLQNQVEILSMKLASVNPMSYGFGMHLDEFMVRPDQSLNYQPPLQHYSPTQVPAYNTDTTATTNTITAATAPTTTTTSFTTVDNIYPHPLVDNPISSLLCPQHQRLNPFSQDNANLLWDVDEERHRFISQAGFSNNLCSFH